MYKREDRKERMNSQMVGIDLGGKESVATYMLPDSDIKEQFKFTMTDEGCNEFKKRTPLERRIAFKASGSAYIVDRNLRRIGYGDITVAHPKSCHGS